MFGCNHNQTSLFIAHLSGEIFVTALGSAAHGNIKILQTLDMRRRVLPGFDGSGAFDGNVAPVVELDDRDSGASCALDVLGLNGVRP